MAENVNIAEMIKLEDGKLAYTNDYDKSLIKKMTEDMMIGERITVSFQLAKATDAKYSQMKRLHACIGQIAKETGSDFDEIKKEVKRRAGLYNVDDKLDSFSKCNFEELQSAIRAAINLGEFLGMSIK